MGTSCPFSSPAQGVSGWWGRGLWMCHGRSLGGPHTFPAPWCPFALGARCQLPVPEGDTGVLWLLSQPQQEPAQPTLPCSPVSLATASAPGDTLRSYANFLYSVSFPLSSTPTFPPVFLSLTPLVFFGENT